MLFFLLKHINLKPYLEIYINGEINIFYFIKLEIYFALNFTLIFHLIFATFGNIIFNDCIKLPSLNKACFRVFQFYTTILNVESNIYYKKV